MPDVLFITPLTPDPTGGGTEQRAFWVLQGLAARARVHCVVTQGRGMPRLTPRRTLALCESFASLTPDRVRRAAKGWTRYQFVRNRLRLPPGGPLTDGLARALGTPLELPTDREIARLGRLVPADLALDRVHVFRVYSAPFIAPLLARRGRRPRLHLDVDDVESTARDRIAALQRAAGQPRVAALTRREADVYRQVEERWLWRFDRLYACSELDRGSLRERFGGGPEVRVLPNIVDPSIVATPGVVDAARPARILFVGTLGYPPNAAAVRLAAREILPVVRAALSRPVELHVVGREAKPDLLADLARIDGCVVHGAVPSVTPHYRDADVVLVPIRAGGGTRIKILEAFAHGRPVVSTPLGAEGLDVRGDAHLLLAESATELAAACARLLTDAALARELVAAGREVLAARYSPDAVEAALWDA